MKKTSIALGFFDGVHIAHQKLISQAVQFGKENNISAIALTFDKAPAELFSDVPVMYITTNSQKAELIESLGATPQFLSVTGDLLSMSPEAFVRDILVEKYNIRHAVCGYNYSFGHKGSGTTETLVSLGEKYGFSVSVVDKVTAFGEDVSSTRIRELLSEGETSLANKLSGRHFSLKGIVSEGKHLGKKLGFPTANVFFEDNCVSLARGVYKTCVTVDEVKMPAITNVGVNPTVGGEKMRSETYIPNFSENLYGKEITIEFVDFIRKETKFESLDMLKNQIEKDISTLFQGG